MILIRALRFHPNPQTAADNACQTDIPDDQSCEILSVDIPTIELAGGFVRCMIAGIHLDRRPAAEPSFTAAVEAIDEDPHTSDGRDRAEEG